jgi:hypothetical protein
MEKEGAMTLAEAGRAVALRNAKMRRAAFCARSCYPGPGGLKLQVHVAVAERVFSFPTAGEEMVVAAPGGDIARLGGFDGFFVWERLIAFAVPIDVSVTCCRTAMNKLV